MPNDLQVQQEMYSASTPTTQPQMSLDNKYKVVAYQLQLSTLFVVEQDIIELCKKTQQDPLPPPHTYFSRKLISS